jgi:hypothetical protein
VPNSLLRDAILPSHFAIVQQYDADHRNTKRPDAGHYAACLIFDGKPQLQPARLSRGYCKNRQRDVAQRGQDFFLNIPQAMRMGQQQRTRKQILSHSKTAWLVSFRLALIRH